jgi:hypothetical protein
MNAVAAAGAGFLIAVLWFDLMFDVQARGGEVSDAALASIGAYYRRVTTQAAPMSRLIPAVMFVTLLAIGIQIGAARGTSLRAWAALALALSAIGLAVGRTVRNAVRLGAGADDRETQGRLARRILGDHLYCLAAMAAVLAIQLLGGNGAPTGGG